MCFERGRGARRRLFKSAIIDSKRGKKKRRKGNRKLVGNPPPKKQNFVRGALAGLLGGGGRVCAFDLNDGRARGHFSSKLSRGGGNGTRNQISFWCVPGKVDVA